MCEPGGVMVGDTDPAKAGSVEAFCSSATASRSQTNSRAAYSIPGEVSNWVVTSWILGLEAFFENRESTAAERIGVLHRAAIPKP